MPIAPLTLCPSLPQVVPDDPRANEDPRIKKMLRRQSVESPGESPKQSRYTLDAPFSPPAGLNPIKVCGCLLNSYA